MINAKTARELMNMDVHDFCIHHFETKIVHNAKERKIGCIVKFYYLPDAYDFSLQDIGNLMNDLGYSIKITHLFDPIVKGLYKCEIRWDTDLCTCEIDDTTHSPHDPIENLEERYHVEKD